MSKTTDDCFEKDRKQQQCQRSDSDPSSSSVASRPTPTAETTTRSKTNASPANPVSPAEYIYNSMIPPTKLSHETAEVAGSTLGKSERCNTGGSSKSGGGHFLSMDLGFLAPDEIKLDGGLAALVDDAMISLRSSEFVKDILLPDSAVTAAAAIKAAEYQPSDSAAAVCRDANPSGMASMEDMLMAEGSCSDLDGGAENNNSKAVTPSVAHHRLEDNREDDDDGVCCPILSLTKQLGRISTGDEVAPLSENFRLSSSDWVKDFEDETLGELGPMHPSLFMGAAQPLPSVSPIPLNAPSSSRYASKDWVKDFEGETSCNLGPMDPSLFMGGQPPDDFSPLPFKTPSSKSEEYRIPLQSSGRELKTPVPPVSEHGIVVHNLPSTSTATSVKKTKTASPSSSTTSKGKKRRKTRVIDDSQAIDPTENDVLFGRGGFTNTHPGNIKFRQKALELRPWYEQSTTSKEEKYRISDLLVESVRGEGNRFLERGEDGLWHEVIGNGARKKASQALRERIKGTRARAAKGSAGNASSIKSAGSYGGGVEDFTVEDVIGDLMPADVVGV